MNYGVFVLVSTVTVVLFQVCVCHLDMIGFRLTRLNTTLYTGGIKVRVSDSKYAFLFVCLFGVLCRTEEKKSNSFECWIGEPGNIVPRKRPMGPAP